MNTLDCGTENMDMFDNGRRIDWGKTSEDYALYRPGPPESFYKLAKHFNIGLPGQRILDQGTGTGVLARQFARQGSVVYGTDISENQIRVAKMMAENEGLDVSFEVAPAEEQPFEEHSFDVITASQCYHYFKKEKWVPEVKRLLKKDGLLLITYFAWIPTQDPISYASEQLVLKYNPDWGAHSWSGRVDQYLDWYNDQLKQIALITYDEDISFTREVWRGRIRALRGIGATLGQDQVIQFDKEHDELLKTQFGDSFIIPHRIVTRIFKV